MLYGDDLDTLVQKANQIAKVATGIQGTQDTRVDRVGGQQYLTIDIDRGSIARYGLNAADVNDVIETAEYYRDVLGFTFERFFGNPQLYTCRHCGTVQTR